MGRAGRVIAALAVVGLLTAAVLAGYGTRKEQGSLDKPRIYEELNRLEALSLEENYTYNPSDTALLESLSRNDPVAAEYAEEARWMLEHGESEHFTHSTAFLRSYLETGDKVPCLPHEIQHTGLAAERGDYDRAQQNARNLRRDYAAWLREVRKRQNAYPQFYTGVDSLLSQIEEVLPRLEKGEFDSHTLQAAEEIGHAGVC